MTDSGSGIPIPPPPTPIPAPPMAHPQPPQMEIPSFRAPDVQLLVQDLAQSRRDLFEERRNSANRQAEERERSRWEVERIRTELGAQIKAFASENEALIRAIGRLQGENDRLREENAILRHGKTNGQVEEKAPPAVAPVQEKQDVVSQLNRPAGAMTTPVPLVLQGMKRSAMTPVVPAPQVMGGSPQIIQPGVGPV